jgi:predicted AAA+ superfamily ATPase
MYDKLIDSFSDYIEVDDYFNTLSFELSKKSVLTNSSNLIFLLGLPGSGKTFLINYLIQKEEDTQYFYFPRGFDTKEEFFSKLNITDIEKDKEIFKNKTHLIVIDEAQLLDNSMLEYIRTLSDTKCFNFLLSMHLDDGKKILSQHHFKSREISIIELDPITKEEMIRYVNKKLFTEKEENLVKKSDFNIIYKLTNGNFRYIKRVMKKSFELLKFAKENKIPKYNKIDKCIITMAAIDLGLIDE